MYFIKGKTLEEYFDEFTTNRKDGGRKGEVNGEKRNETRRKENSKTVNKEKEN